MKPCNTINMTVSWVFGCKDDGKSFCTLRKIYSLIWDHVREKPSCFILKIIVFHSFSTKFSFIFILAPTHLFFSYKCIRNGNIYSCLTHLLLTFLSKYISYTSYWFPYFPYTTHYNCICWGINDRLLVIYLYGVQLFVDSFYRLSLSFKQ